MHDQQLESSHPHPPGRSAPAAFAADTVAEHYETLLAPIYAWSNGPFPAALARGHAMLAAAGVGAGQGALAVDLGAGFGLPAIPLAELGHQVIAIDSSAALLAELRRLASRQLAIRTVHDDLRRFRAHVLRPCALITCLGDTLTHLETTSDVERLFDDAAAVLGPGGQLLLAFRDYTSALEGTGRFIPVRSDDDRILTCFLEYQPGGVQVHDVLHERSAGEWTMRVSRYRKLRLAPTWVASQLAARGFTLTELPRAGGMVTFSARRV